jgi:hypothetical protein
MILLAHHLVGIFLNKLAMKNLYDFFMKLHNVKPYNYSDIIRLKIMKLEMRLLIEL